MTAVHFVVPAGIDDAANPSGGNAYDRRCSDALRSLGWDVWEHEVPGRWPSPDEGSLQALATTIAGVPDGALVLVDGSIASAAPGELVPAAQRIRLVVLVHLPFGDGPPGHVLADAAAAECAVLTAATAVVTTSQWARARLLQLYPLRPADLHVAPPGVDAADVSPGRPDGRRLLCVAAVAHHKGHDVLFDSLAALADRGWHCVCAGSLDREPGFVEALRAKAAATGIAERVTFVGPLSPSELDLAYANADVFVLASRGETYGMVVTEALARALPVVASDVGGVSESLGRTPSGHLPGLLVPSADAPALAAALAGWLDDADLRARLRAAAVERRAALTGWDTTAAQVATALMSADGERVGWSRT